jgi:hypothetical protein
MLFSIGKGEGEMALTPTQGETTLTASRQLSPAAGHGKYACTLETFWSSTGAISKSGPSRN